MFLMFSNQFLNNLMILNQFQTNLDVFNAVFAI